MKMLNLFALLLTSALGYAGPILVGNGAPAAGESEFSLTLVRTRLPELLAMCDSICDLTARETLTLNDLKQRAANPPEAIFTDRPESANMLYVITHNGGRVVFNTNELWVDPAKTQAYNLTDAFKLWLRILAELPPGLPAGQLISVQNALISKLEQRLLRVKSETVEGVGLEALTFREASDRLYVRDADFVAYDLNPMMATAIACTQSFDQWRVHSLRWAELRKLSDGSYSARLEMIQTWKCGPTSERAKAKITLRTENQKPFHILPESIQVFFEAE